MKEMITIQANQVPTSKLHGYLLGAIGPRPIALASTMDEHGRPNLSPFSFFNVFSANPPVVIFSPARRVRDNTIKHTLENVKKVKEVVINIVNFDIVQQMSLSSTEYGEGENEFIKAGLTMLESVSVSPFRVAESPVQLECSVTKVEPLGLQGGAGNLVFAEVLKIHIDKSVLDENGAIDQEKIDLVARMGGNWYSRASKGLFEVPKPISTKGIGVDALPSEIKNSEVLTGNNLGMLANVPSIPTETEIKKYFAMKAELLLDLKEKSVQEIHLKAQELLDNKKIDEAWKILLAK